MILFELKGLPKLKAAQLEEIIALYVKAGAVADPEVKTNADKVNWIKDAFETMGGYPHIVTKEDIEANGEEVGKEGDVIILPPMKPEEEIRNGALLDAEAILSDLLTAEELAAKLEELGALETPALVDAVNAIRTEQGLPIAPSSMDPQNSTSLNEKKEDDKKDEKKGKKDEKGQNEPQETHTGTVSPQHLLERAVKTGKFKHEGRTIMDFRPKIAFGKTRFELYAVDGTTYIINIEDVAKVTRLALE